MLHSLGERIHRHSRESKGDARREVFFLEEVLLGSGKDEPFTDKSHLNT